MKILAFVDSHGSLSATRKISKMAEKADVVVCAGDFTLFGDDVDFFVHKMCIAKKPVLIVPGNHEFREDVKKACSLFDNAYYLHNKGFEAGDYVFIGFEGNGFSKKDQEFEEAASGLKKMIKKGKKIILITHAPPFKTKIDLVLDNHCGNESIRKFIESNRIDLVISGHLHENSGKEDKIKNTRVVNPGPMGKMLTI